MRRSELFLVAALLAGCAALRPQPDRTQYFLLEPVAVGERHPVAGFDRSVGIGPIVVPDHLAGAIVTRLTGSEIAISDTERWAEPLRESLGATLRQDLAARLGSEKVVAFPWEAAAAPELAVRVELRRFERTTRNTVELFARFAVERGGDRSVLATRESRLTRTFAGSQTRDAVAALSAAVGDLAGEIAAALRSAPAENAK